MGCVREAENGVRFKTLYGDLKVCFSGLLCTGLSKARLPVLMRQAPAHCESKSTGIDCVREAQNALRFKMLYRDLEVYFSCMLWNGMSKNRLPA